MTETEIKLPVEDAERMRAKLRRLGWRVVKRRCKENNFVYDRPDRSLLKTGRLLRVRTAGKSCWLTVKRPAKASARHKVRKEYEIETRNLSSLRGILEALGFKVVWQYQKRRTELGKKAAPGKILLDETPIGNFLELEGRSEWIDRTARQLGYASSDYITATYRELFLQRRGRRSGGRHDMVF